MEWTQKETVKKQIELAVDAWFNTVLILPALHWANITLGGVLGGSNAVSGIHRFASVGNARRYLAAYLTIGSTEILSSLLGANGAAQNALRETARVVNAITDELKDPNLEGIPIHASMEQDSRDITVDTHTVIVQEAMCKNIVVDNAVPQLKQWQVRGYLTSLPEGIDPYLVIKPSLKAQKLLLDVYATSRRPLWFKTHDNSFEKVLITHIETAYDTNALNAVSVNLVLTEFKVMETENALLAAILGALE